MGAETLLIHHDIRAHLAQADRPIATLNLSGRQVTVGIDESDSDPTIYLGFPGLTNERIYASPCEAHLFIAALATAHCAATGRETTA